MGYDWVLWGVMKVWCTRITIIRVRIGNVLWFKETQSERTGWTGFVINENIWKAVNKYEIISYIVAQIGPGIKAEKMRIIQVDTVQYQTVMILTWRRV